MPNREWEVVRPWFGVSAGQRFSADAIHPSLRNNVRPVLTPVGGGELTTSVAKPGGQVDSDEPSAATEPDGETNDQSGGGQGGVGKQQNRNRRQRN